MKKFSFGRFLVYTASGLVLLLCAAVLGIHYNQDRLLALFVKELNKHLKTKVELQKLELSLWEQFPQAAITMVRPVMLESVAGSTQPMAQAQRLYFTFNLTDLLQQRYLIREVILESGTLNLSVDPQGNVNYLVYQSADDGTKEAVSFDVEKITLRNVAFKYHNQQTQQEYAGLAHELVARLALQDSVWQIGADGRLLVEAIRLGKEAYFKKKDVKLHTALALDQRQSLVTIKPSTLKIGRAAYQVAGTVNTKYETVLDLTAKGKNTGIQALLALLPPRLSRPLAAYQSKGHVYFSAAVKGPVTAKQSPLITASFGCREATFFHPDSRQRLENLRFTGSFSNGPKHHSRTSVLELHGISGTLQGRPFSGNLTYRNFTDPSLKMQVTADVDLAHVLQLFPLEAIQEGQGEAQLKLAFDGNLAELKRNPASSRFKASGEINLRQASFLFKDFDLLLSGLDGRLQVNKSHFAVQNLRGQLGRTDFHLNGFFKNAIAWLLTDHPDLSLEADLTSRFVDLDQLLSQQAATPAPPPAAGSAPVVTVAHKPAASAQYELAFAPGFACNLQTDIAQLHFRRLRARHLKGRVVLRDQVLTSPSLSVQALGGSFSLKGSVDARQKDLIKVVTISKLQQIYADSLLYVLENFGQDFIQDKNVRGQLTADIASDIYFDHALTPRTELLLADVNGRISNGQLLQFAPLQSLARFVDAHELSNLRFSELHNKIQIRNRTIYLPEMEISTNLTAMPSLSVSGSHTFDQRMDYRLRLPLTQLQRKHDPDEAYGQVEQRETTPGNLFLTLKGGPSDFRIAYDTERVKDKLKQDWQNEKEELKNALTGKTSEEPVKKAEVNQDEFFDF